MTASKQDRRRRPGGRSLVIAAGCVVLAVWGLLWSQLYDSPLTRVPAVDEHYYVERAVEIATVSFAPDEAFYMSPLYPYLLWITGSAQELDAYGVFADGPPMGIRILQAILWIGIALLIWVIGREVLPPRWSGLAVALFVLYRPGLVWANTTLLEVPFAFCVLAVVALLVTGLSADRWIGKAILLGLAIGFAWLLRGTGFVLLIPVAWALVTSFGSVKRALAPALVVGIVTLAVLSPVLIHNARLAGRPAVSMNAGIVLYAGNGPNANGYQVTSRGVNFADDPTWGWWLEELTGETFDDTAELDRAWTREALRVIREDPRRTIGLWLKKVWIHWISREIPNVTPLGSWAHHAPILHAFFVPYGLLSALGLVGLVVFGRRPGAWRLLALTTVGIVALQSLLFVISRYRFVLVPLLCLFGAAVVAELIRVNGTRRSGIVALVVLAIVATHPWGQRDVLADLRTAATVNEAARWQAWGLHLESEGQSDDARRAWTRSIDLFRRGEGQRPSDALRREIVRTQALLGDMEGARRTLDDASRGADAETRARLEKDWIRMAIGQGDLEAALTRLAAYVSDHPDDREMGRLHVNLLYRTGRAERALNVATRSLERFPDDPRAIEDVARTLAILRRLDEAERVLTDAVTRFPEDRPLGALLTRVRQEIRNSMPGDGSDGPE